MQHQVHCDLMKFVTFNMRIIMFRDTDIILDNTYTHVNNGSQTCPWLDHIAMSYILSESTVDCHTLQDVAYSDYCAFTFT